jgi:serine/threonine-protein kinase
MTQIDVGARVGPYEILRKIGTGGMGAVYEALHPTIERRVAIKVLHSDSARSPEMASRFLNEARAVNRIAHPSMVQISDLGQLADGTAYLVMELLVGEPLNVRLKRLGGRLPLTQTLDLGSQIADALSAAHDKGIIHRDLKPENIMVVADPVAPRGERIKVLDFGIAKLAESGMGAGEGTKSSVLMGTPRYMSPEQCRGGGPVDAKSDVYSLGIMMYQLIAGRLPFESKAAGELIVMHITEPPPSLLSLAPDLPPALIPNLVPVIERLLVKSPAARPAMSEVAQQLQALLRLLPSTSAEVLAQVPPPAALPAADATPAVQSVKDNAQLTVPLSTVSDGQTPLHKPLAAAQPIAEPAGGLTATMSADGASTLGQSVGQFRPASRRRILIFAPPTLLAIILLFSLTRAWRPQKSPTDSGVPAPQGRASVPYATAAAGRTKWQLRSEPAGATVVRKADGRELGKTPLWVDAAADGGPLAVELQLAGFLSADFELHPQDEEQRLIRLTAERRPLPARPALSKKKERAKLGKSFFDGID